jgi:methionyl-tRNA synthetase
MIEPYMPAAAEKIAGFFGLSFGTDLEIGRNPEGLSWKDLGLQSGLKEVGKCEVLFSKLEDEHIEALRLRYSGSQGERGAESKEDGAAHNDSTGGKAELPGFSNTLDLRVAKIVKIQRHPKADKLYIETLEIGNEGGAAEERVIVSGLVPFYTEEELLGRHIIVAYNLKAAKLRGVESRGMLLAASDMNGPPGEDGKPTERCEVLDAAGIPVGTKVILEGAEAGNPPAEIDIDTFFSVPMLVKDNAVTAGGKALCLDGKPVKTAVIGEGEVR